MIERKKKIKIIQISLLVLGSLILFLTYANKSNLPKEEIVSKEIQERIKNQKSSVNENSDIFYNIEYSGLDLAGNRYILKSKEAFNEKENQEIVNMKFVEAFFYFKDNTVLEVKSDYGVYNNKTLNMKFKKNVRAIYEKSELFAQEAEYSNVESFLTITDQVRINDSKGTMFADKLLFDIKKQTLNIASFDDGKINANINLK